MEFTAILRSACLCVCLAVAASMPSMAQGSDIRGTVTDSTTGERVPFASIVVLGTGKGAATNLNGFFLIANIPPGDYQVSAGAVGFLRQVRMVTVRPGMPVVLDIRLVPEAVQMEEVVVREEAHRGLKELTTSIHVMDTRDLKIVPVTVQSDVLRSVQILPGVVSSSDVSSQFYVRGGASDQNLILLDGIRVYSPYHAFGVFSIFDSDIVNATEVYTGAFPAGYGGRLSSVVSLTTRDGRLTSPSVTVAANQLSARLEADGPLSERTRMIVNARTSLSSAAFTRMLRTEAPISFYDVFAKLTTELPGTATRFGFMTFQTGDRLPSSDPMLPEYEWRNSLFGVRATSLFGDRLYVNTLLSYTSASASRRPVTEYAPISDASTVIREFALRADATIYADGGSMYLAGFDFAIPSTEYRLVNPAGAERQVRGTSPELSGWVRLQTGLGAWKVDAGVHVDAGGLSTGSSGLDLFQPRIHLSTSVFEHWRVKASFGRHTQNVITLGNEDDLISVFEAWTVIPDDLPSQKADHVILSLQGNVTAEVGTEVQVYHKQYHSLVAFNRDKIDDADPDYVTGRGAAYGAEAMVRYGKAPLDVYLAYSFARVMLTQAGLTYAPRYDRRHTVKALGVLEIFDGLDLSLRWEFGTGFPYTPTVGFYDRLRFNDVIRQGFLGETGPSYVMLGSKNALRLPAYHRLDASVAYRFRIGRIGGEAGLHLLNLYDRRNLFYVDRRTGERIDMLRLYPTATVELTWQ